MKRIKVLGTDAVIKGKYLQKLHEMGAPAHKNQFRVICGCISMADANRQCKALGLDNRTFQSDYTMKTANEKELELAGEGGLFIEISNDRYVSVKELQEIEVTDETFAAMAQYCIEHNESMDFEYKGGHYRLLVQEVKK
jgi:hypothetical protein